MTDGRVGELDFRWAPGATIEPDAGGCAASLPDPSRPSTLTVIEWNQSGFVDLVTAFGGEPFEDYMAYAQIYVVAERRNEVFLGIASNSIQVILNCETVWINNVARQAVHPCDAVFPQNENHDGVYLEVVLEPGINSLILKLTNPSYFALRFQDEFGDPLDLVEAGLTTRHDVTDLEEEPPHCGNRFQRSDADGDGKIGITDAIFVLNYLYLGSRIPPCDDAADVDDSGTLQVTDAIYLLGHLFLGGPPPPSPYRCCGHDDTADSLDCAEVSAGCR